jgi:Flp pilus assembly protein TadB
MRRSEEHVGWRSFEWAVTALLTICAALLAVCAALMWSYLPAVSTTPNNSSSVTKYQAETEAMSKEQQALTNSKLDSIRDELRALNQKAAGAASVAPPSTR